MIFIEMQTKMAANVCRVCSDFKNWSRQQQKKSGDVVKKECPVDSEELGRATWTFLHTVAAYYPTTPSTQQEKDMENFIYIISKVYPCEPCAQHMQERLKIDPPIASSQRELSQWMCRLHNEVNEHLGKPQFDCSRVDERWLRGWSDGSCD